MEEKPGRIHFLDVMRGVAVVVMVMGHSIDSVLSDHARVTEAFRLYDAVRGFTAPIFLFVAGFAFAVVTVRKWDVYHTWSKPFRSRLSKVVLLLIIGYALHLPFYSLNKLLSQAGPKDYAQFFQSDVLHCVAFSMITLQAFVMLSRTPRIFALVTGAATTLMVLVTPIIWSIDFARRVGPVLAPYFNQSSPSIFPVFPYAAFMFSGAVVGKFFLVAHRDGKERKFFSRIIVIALAAAVGGVVFDLLPVTVFPPHDYWKASPNFFLLRLSAVLFVTTGFFYLRKLPDVLERPVLALGQASLLVYSAHLVIVYGSAANIGLAQIVGRVLPYYAAAGVGIAVLCAMVWLTHAWTYLRTHHEWPSRVVQAGMASTIVYLFFTNPW